jgi:hypothetical protein
MKKAWLPAGALVLAVCAGLWGSTLLHAAALEEGEITGTIERTNEKFLRDYETLDYGSKREWKEWGRGLKSMGWIVVKGDSGELKDYLLLVIDTRTAIEKKGSEKGGFADLVPGLRIRAKYKMGWDALHALYVKTLDE